MVEQSFLNVLVAALWSLFLLIAFLQFFIRLRKNHYRKAIVLSGSVLSVASVVQAPTAVFAQVDNVDSWKNISDPIQVRPQAQTDVQSVPSEVRVMQEENLETKEVLENVDGTNSLALGKYVVVQGDNLWSIAKIQAHENEDFVELWKQIISNNTDRLRSKNPNLIYPGEELIIRK